MMKTLFSIWMDLGYHYFRKHPHWPKVKVALQPHVQCFSTDLLEAIEADGWVERWFLDAPKKTQFGSRGPGTPLVEVITMIVGGTVDTTLAPTSFNYNPYK